ncbi:MAG: triose-phosphate isomerase, partial [Coriobacteriales bacterium]|nr:triose-phosphate isomerase [Coriobacteriales bacterium]
EATALSTRILYGGSLNAGNIALFAAEPDIDGGLVGGASLNASEFVRLVSNFRQAV